MQNQQTYRSIFWLIFATIFITGCSAKGIKFEAINPIPDGKGVVYIYRSPSIIGSGVYGTASANNIPLTNYLRSVTRRPRSFRRLLVDDLGHWLNNRDIAVHIPCRFGSG